MKWRKRKLPPLVCVKVFRNLLFVLLILPDWNLNHQPIFQNLHKIIRKVLSNQGLGLVAYIRKSPDISTRLRSYTMLYQFEALISRAVDILALILSLPLTQ
ncbi:hypothetical protein GGU11DRAFT_50584 [Lentinula aff. detonsa]|nr:hypothetical protein GGU11DRAFT_50584 [Lentinula aff. detonsa]